VVLPVVRSRVSAVSDYARVAAKERQNPCQRVSPRGQRGRDRRTALQSQSPGRGHRGSRRLPGRTPDAETMDLGCRLALGL